MHDEALWHSVHANRHAQSTKNTNVAYYTRLVVRIKIRCRRKLDTAGKARLLCSNLPAHMCTVPLDITCNRLSATPELPRGKTHPAQVTDKLCTERNRRRALAERRTLPGAPARDRLTVMGVDKQANASGLKTQTAQPGCAPHSHQAHTARPPSSCARHMHQTRYLIGCIECAANTQYFHGSPPPTPLTPFISRDITPMQHARRSLRYTSIHLPACRLCQADRPARHACQAKDRSLVSLVRRQQYRRMGKPPNPPGYEVTSKPVPSMRTLPAKAGHHMHAVSPRKASTGKTADLVTTKTQLAC